MKKVTIMCRVSSDEQAKGYSLDDQLEKLTNYCNRRNYEIVHTIKEDHSAKSFDRPAWKQWMEKIKTGKVHCDEILVTSWDRFSRDLTGALNMIDYLRKRNITPQSIEQPIDYNIPENLFMLAIYLANPDVDNRRRSIKVKGGIRQGLKQGRWPRRPVYGFMSSKNEDGTHIIVHHPEKAPIVREIFEEVVKGTSQKEVREYLKEKEIFVSRNNMHKILKNVLYMGKIIVPASENEPKTMIQGIHEPIVTESLFYQVQQILSGNRKSRGKFVPKYAKLRDDFHLRGILNCYNCGNTMTASYSKGKLGKRYGYYHCNHCKGQRVSSIKVHEAFDELLISLEIDSSLHELYTAILEEQLQGSEKENKSEIKKIQKQLDLITERLQKSQDLMLDGKLDPEEYVEIKARYSVQQKELKSKIEGFKSTSKELIHLTKTGLNLLVDLSQTYYRATIQLKQKIVSSIFSGQLYFDGKNCRTPKLNEFIDWFPRQFKASEQKERGQLKLSTQLSPTAESEGFEPPVRSPGQRFSRPPHSTTLPTLL